jgi:hypothetical protein
VKSAPRDFRDRHLKIEGLIPLIRTPIEGTNIKTNVPHITNWVSC